MNVPKQEPEPLGIVVIHGAAVMIGQRALAFLGPSGTGKSTISRILEPFAPVIADDRLYLIPQGSDWLVSDATIRAMNGALSEKEALNLVGVPLGAVFRLHQSPQVHIAPIDERQTCRYLVSAVYEHFWSNYFDIQVQKAAFTRIADIARKTPGFDLHFNKSTEIVEALYHAVGAALPISQ